MEDLLDAGIDVVTNVNVQHLASLNETVETLTGVAERETVPDTVVAAAESVELIDVDPRTLRSRLASSDVLAPGLADMALSGYTPPRTLPPSATWRSDGWRTMVCSTRPGDPRRAATVRLPRAADGCVAALTGDPEGEHVLRRAPPISRRRRTAELVGLHVRGPSDLVEHEPDWLEGQRRLLAELGGHYAEIAAVDVASAGVEFADAEHARQLVLGAYRRSWLQELLHGSVVNRAVRHAGAVEIHVVPTRHVRDEGRRTPPATGVAPTDGCHCRFVAARPHGSSPSPPRPRSPSPWPPSTPRSGWPECCSARS